MGPVSRECKSRLIKDGDRRLVEIPKEFFLEGDEVILIQDRDGVISIQPGEAEAREAVWARFNPFIEWGNGTWPKETPVWDDERLAWVPTSQV